MFARDVGLWAGPGIEDDDGPPADARGRRFLTADFFFAVVAFFFAAFAFFATDAPYWPR